MLKLDPPTNASRLDGGYTTDAPVPFDELAFVSDADVPLGTQHFQIRSDKLLSTEA